ncbi:MAG: sigma-54-dependent Fis family transcriptional regulator [Desulfobacterales bacterium]|nr:sigma-54-dependent Fis family transcriptional regulator [Desulfobacterales bacterium]MBF0395367.1 sigma-54-dependent Fis family transcriptional regulator [Desulfobacterales bacterium]
MADILIIDDDEMICTTLAERVKNIGHTAHTAGTIFEGLEKAALLKLDIIFLDVRLPDGNGLDSLTKFRQLPSDPEIVIITGVADVKGAELAIKNGAWDYIQKPFSRKEITLQLSRALEYRSGKKIRNKDTPIKREGIIGSSIQINICLEFIANCAKRNVNVLITGETGTGKELFARAIHDNSSNCANKFVVVDCTVLPEQLIESVLFGHMKGSFTGANETRNGLVKQADGGTLFLDEVGELPLSVQKSFLRVLQEKRFRSVGSMQEVQSDFRLVSATNRNLDDMVRKGEFREDLLFRLRTYLIELPPLRERHGDIIELINSYTDQLCQKHGLKKKGFSPEFIEILEAYDWPGNIRELVSTLEKAILADPDHSILYPRHLPDSIRIKYVKSAVIKKQSDISLQSKQTASTVDKNIGSYISDVSSTLLKSLPNLKDYRETLIEEAERNYMQNLMKIAEKNIRKACEISGLSRARLYALLKKFEIKNHP